MSTLEYISAEEIARLRDKPGVDIATVRKALNRDGVPSVPDPTNKRRRLYATSALSSQQLECLRDRQVASQPVLPFAVSLAGGSRPQAPAPVPSRYGEKIDREISMLLKSYDPRWERFVGQILGGVLIRTNSDYVEGVAELYGSSASTLYQLRKLHKRLNYDDTAFAKARVPGPRPGRSRHTFFDRPGNEWKYDRLCRLYLSEAKRDQKQAWLLLLAAIDTASDDNGERPTIDQCRTALRKISKPTYVLARQGEKAFYDQCAPYISRRPPEHSNLIWSTDQKVADVRVQDAGHRLGRLTSVNFIDVTSNRWLGCYFAPVLSSDVVMRAAVAAMTLNHTKPRYVQHDLGKEFRAIRFSGGMVKIAGEKLFGEACGMWERLSVKVIRAIGDDPRTKPIERWHAELRKFDQQFPTWTGNNTDERPERLAKLEAQHAAWLKGEAENPHIPTIQEYIERFVAWCAQTWNRETRGYGKYLEGMTPEQCWFAKQPPEGFTAISEDEINRQSCERRIETVATGGQVNLQIHGRKLEYVAEELFHLIGKKVEVLLSRLTYRTVMVIYPVTGGTASCSAEVKQEYDWVPEGEDAQERLRAQIRAHNRVKRTVRLGIQAGNILEEAANPAEVLTALESLPASNPLASRGLFGQTASADSADGADRDMKHPEVSSTEFLMNRKRKTASDIADRWE